MAESHLENICSHWVKFNLMQKKDFIQRCVIAHISSTNKDGGDVINRAERYWDRLSERGYGEAKQLKTENQNTDWYKKLSIYQKEWFDKFWAAFCTTGFSGGKQGAAMRWGQLGELNADDYGHIVSAARKESERRPETVLQGTTPIMAQGWLNARRYDDHITEKETSQARQVSKEGEKVKAIIAEIAHFKKIGNEFSMAEAKRLEIKLENIRGKIK